MKRYEKLINALISARVTAEMLDTKNDGGACNFDLPVVIMPRGIRESTVQEIGRLTGIYFEKDYRKHRDGSVWFADGDFLKGQADRRTRAAKTFSKCLQADGIKSYVFSVLD